jgi:hypothetical protein
MADAIRVPEPLSSDTDDVTDALDVAQSLWENGKRADAIHWVKRAAESAKGDPTRMASLARAAEDLERAAAPRAATPPPVPVAKPPPVPPPVPKVSKPPPVPPARTAPSIPPPPAIPAPAPTPRSVPSMTKAPSVTTSTAAPSTQTKISVPPAPAGPVVVARPSKVPPQLLQQPPASEDRVRLASSPSDKTLRVRASMRVSVKTSVRDGGLLVVRALADGAAVPAGTREALLTFVNDDVDDLGAST